MIAVPQRTSKENGQNTADAPHGENPLGDLGQMLPGKELERAAANVATDAGKSLLLGLRHAFGALTAEWIAKKEAQAAAARASIATTAKIANDRAVADARRHDELDEIKHQLILESAQRRANRMLQQMASEQENFERIAQLSLELIETNRAEEPETINNDWLLRFAEYAQKISDKDLQILWSRILTGAGTKTQPTLLPSTLFLMSQFDTRTALDFSRICNYVYAFGSYPTWFPPPPFLTLNTDVMYLEEIGLIRRDSHPKTLKVATFRVDLRGNVTYSLSSRGKQLFETIILPYHRPLSYINLLDELISFSMDQSVHSDVDIYIHGNADIELHVQNDTSAKYKSFDPDDLDDTDLRDLLNRFKPKYAITQGRRPRR